MPELAEIRKRCRQALDVVRTELLAERGDKPYWTGELSPSALSTATAISAMAAVLLHDTDPASRNTDPASRNTDPASRNTDPASRNTDPASRNTDPASRNEFTDAATLRKMIRNGMTYLCTQQNPDGGFGDTDRSHSNIATSYLALSASVLSGRVGETELSDDALKKLNRYLDDAGRIAGLKQRYGKDKTFVVPIMNNMAIAGLVSWDEVARLPFEAAVFPQSWYRFLRMPVVSYAVPALVAIGQARHFLGRPTWLPLRAMRSLCVTPTLRVLQKMQPASGGYLEATPLTAFVVMSLAATGRCQLEVVRKGLQFLCQSMLPDGSWPIDTNLATWVTSLSVHALACDPDDSREWYSENLALWHLDCQHLQRHPFTGANPGGWGWTDLSGAVPDGDDTPGAILALGLMKRHASAPIAARIDDAIEKGLGWLQRLQNRNGGWPTFCRGWGKLPFDRSSTDLTAHTLRAAQTATVRQSPATDEWTAPRRRGIRFLEKQQNQDGSFLPLWFGNQDREDESNPIYGTAKVLIACELNPTSESLAVKYLLENQNADGGWGGGVSLAPKIAEFTEQNQNQHNQNQHWAFADNEPPQIPGNLTSSVEETALAIEALTTLILRNRTKNSSQNQKIRLQSAKERSPCEGIGLQDGANQNRNPLVSQNASASQNTISQKSAEIHGHVFLDTELSSTENFGSTGNNASMAAILRGVDFLAEAVADRRHRFAWPIGFYFAKLWYHERLYPMVFTAAALGKFLRATDDEFDPDWPR